MPCPYLEIPCKMATPSFLVLTRADIVIVTFLPKAKLKINLPPNRKFRLSYSNKYDTAYHLLLIQTHDYKNIMPTTMTLINFMQHRSKIKQKFVFSNMAH